MGLDSLKVQTKLYFCILSPPEMPVDIDDLIELLSTLASEAGMQVTVKHSLKGGLITGAVAAAGGIIMGPPGLAVGKDSVCRQLRCFGKLKHRGLHNTFWYPISHHHIIIAMEICLFRHQ